VVRFPRRVSRGGYALFRKRLRELRSLAEASGFRFVRRYGSPFAYVVQFDAV
jgi:hypothetical protein